MEETNDAIFKMRSDGAGATLYPFGDASGYLVHPKKTVADVPLALGHTASASPWQDADVHLHEVATEIFVLLQGELFFLIEDSALALRPGEILVVPHDMPHAVIGGVGPIEHIGLRAPAVDDRKSVGPLPAHLPTVSEEEPREQHKEWGYRIPLSDGRNQNCWLLGAGAARFACDHLALSYGYLQTAEEAASISAREQLHLHTRSWEFYLVLQGRMTLLVETFPVAVEAGDLLEVPPGLCHLVTSRQAPFSGLTIRAPLAIDDKLDCDPA